MTEDRAAPDDLAAAVADGADLDWAALAARADTPHERERVARFALLARIAGVHADVAIEADTGAAARDGAFAPPPPYAPGDHWGPLRIVALLASGTFGTVYRAHDPALSRDVALKILHVPAIGEHLASDAVAEGRLLARVRHPHVVSVYGADQHDGRVGLWMEVIEGRTLEDELAARGPLPVSEVLAIGAALADALRAVHAAGLLHRDLKTQNVMRDARDGRVVLMDFSAGRDQVDGGSHGVWPATIAGSPLYIAPELLTGAPASARTDVYSLGVILFRLLTTRFPVDGATLAEIELAHGRGDALALERTRPDVPARVSRVVRRALQRDPGQRYPSVEELERDLCAAREAERGRSRTARAVAAVALLACTLGVWAAPRMWRPSAPPLGFSARGWILIADFENRTGDATFDDVLEQALTRELSASRFVNVVPRARVEDTLALMRQPPDAPLDVRRAREVSLRDGGVQAVLAGHIQRVGTAYVLTTDIVNPADGSVHATISDDVTDAASLLPRVREQALRVREALGEALPVLPRRSADLARVSTTSLEALQLYSRAAALLEGEAWLARDDAASRYETADRLLADATRIDPSFASAWALRTRASSAANRPPAVSAEFATRSLALAAQATPEERYFIEGVAHRVHADGGPGRRADLERAAAAFETLVHLEPDHHWALIELAPVYRRLGRRDDAERTALRAAELRPNSLHFAAGAANVHLGRRDTAALRRVATHALSLVPAGLEEAGGPVSRDISWLRMWEAREAWMAGDVRRVQRLLSELEPSAINSSRAFLHNEMVHAWHGLGRFEDARRVAQAADAWQREFFLTLLDGRQERWNALRPVLAARQEEWPFVNRFSYLYVWAGLLDRAEWLVVQRKRRPATRDWQAPRELEGMLRVAQGRHAEATDMFAPVLADDQFPRVRMHEYVGLARAGLGDARGAIAHLERFEREPVSAMRGGWSTYDWMRCLTLLAELYRDNGRAADAGRVAATVRAYLAVADDDNPFAARLARLP